MNLELTTREYLSLLKAVYLADCVANGHANITGDENREITRIRRKVFALAEEAGFGDLVRRDPVHDDPIESESFAYDMDVEFMEPHIDMVFWREAIHRFTDKIMDERFGAEMSGWSDAKYKRCRAAIEKKVERELQLNGLKNVFLLGDFR